MAKVAIVQAKPSKNDYKELFEDALDFYFRGFCDNLLNLQFWLDRFFCLHFWIGFQCSVFLEEHC